MKKQGSDNRLHPDRSWSWSSVEKSIPLELFVKESSIIKSNVLALTLSVVRENSIPLELFVKKSPAI